MPDSVLNLLFPGQWSKLLHRCAETFAFSIVISSCWQNVFVCCLDTRISAVLSSIQGAPVQESFLIPNNVRVADWEFLLCVGGKKATSSGNSQSFIPKAVLSHLLLCGPWGCQWTISVSDIVLIQITDFSAVISQCAVTCSCFYILQLVTLVSHCTQHYTAADL